MTHTGNLFVLSAPSGAGKTTVSRYLQDNKLVRVSISHTTRQQRQTEENGKAYFFVSRDEFVKHRETGDFLEWAEVYGNLYGTSKAWVEERLAEGENVLLEIDCQGARQVKQKMSAAILLFLRPSDPAVLEKRLIKRGENTAADIEKRFLAAQAEITQEVFFDYVIINDHLEAALGKIRAIIKEHNTHGKNYR